MEQTEPEGTAQERLEAFMREHDVTVSAVFVPWSKSRSAKGAKTVNVMRAGKLVPEVPVTKKDLNWRVTVKRGDREVLTTDYSAGIGHAPAYQARKVKHSGLSIYDAESIDFEVEHGKQAKGGWSGVGVRPGEPILPDPCDVLASLAMDASVLDAGTFEGWASDLGYDADSRKAEGIYRACLEIALKLRAGLGDDGLRALQDAVRDY